MTIATPDATRVRRRQPAATAAKERLRLWLRLLRASRGIETELRERLRVTYDVTLPQFDVLAALHRHEHGLTMTELSRYLMVSNGNVTGIVDRLVEVNLVERAASPGDRRATVVRLTGKGEVDFSTIAAVHETWVDELLGGFSKVEASMLIGHLDGLVDRMRCSDTNENAPRKGGKRR